MKREQLTNCWIRAELRQCTARRKTLPSALYRRSYFARGTDVFDQ